MPRRAHLTLLTLAALAACGSSTTVDAYPTEPGTEVVCDALFADSPPRVAGADAVRLEHRTAAVWGDPPIILRCGIEPAESADPATCRTIDGVSWTSEPLVDGTLFTSVGRRFRVSLEVPDAHDASAALTDVAEVVSRHDPRDADCP